MTMLLIAGFIAIVGAFLFVACMFSIMFDKHESVIPPAPKLKKCILCDCEQLKTGLCKSCESFINEIKYCETHKIAYDGKECPKCKYGAFAQYR